MAHSYYKSQYPQEAQVDDGIKSFFEEFYKISDTPVAHERYVENFTEDAVLVMGSKRRVGSDKILQIRKGLWAVVAATQHTAIKSFPFGSGSDEFMLYGTVDYTLKDGRKHTAEWAARANLVKDGARWKMRFYQVYLDTTIMHNAKHVPQL